ncbi:hypothetical protein GCM10027039_01750 [Terrabacter koreensis]
MSAHDELARALEEAVDLGLIIPCAGSDDWTSEDADTRAAAAQRCDGCPCLNECAAAADETKERWGVWAGRDRSPRTKTKENPAA